MFRNKSVNVHQFAMIPRSDIPRSSFDREFMHKTTLNSGLLVPVYVDEVLPGDTFNFSATMFARMATPIYPLMDNMYLDSFFFFVPYRLVWDNFVKMMGEQDNPGDSVSYTIPQMVSKASGYDIGSLQDYMGLPTLGQLTAAATYSHSALPLRAYNLIWNEWFRDENLQNAVTVDTGDAASVYTNYSLLRRGKRRDYITSALPFAQKGTAVSMPLGTRAPISGLGYPTGTTFPNAGATVKDATTTSAGVVYPFSVSAVIPTVRGTVTGATGVPDVYADLSAATAATINQIRQAFQIQRLLERDARGGTRYTEALVARFGVHNPDARLQRPEYLGGGTTPLNINPVAQTNATSVTGSTTPLGQLGAMATILAKGHGFSQSFLEHGIVLGLVSIRADLSYQQGVRKMWNRLTRYDHYEPVFAHLGEQTILNREIYCKGDSDPNDSAVFGYQERWAEYRYLPSMITGLMRSTAAGTLDAWHLSQKFTSLPTLNSTFIQDTPPVSRVIAVPSQPEFIFDCYCRCRTARAMPMYSVPGLIDHF